MIQPSVLALLLAHNVHAIASHKDAGRCYHDIRDAITQIEHAINRPPAPRFCGQCDTKIDRKICGLALYAPRTAIEVTCPNPQCRTLHNIEKLYTRTLHNAETMTFPREVLIGNQRTDNPDRYTTGIMGELGEFVHWQTFNRWVRENRLRPATYVRPNGRRSFHRHTPQDTPEYRLADVRKTKRLMDHATKPKAS
ncbi:hypothetical protein [Mycobacterium malmoense]|uniref:hypothetical protein n=1 Tax=Mycobacterium malmoense TaxID=1780 RepID=UPI0008F7FE40|nr:hypothetical protein [Mycobacterium malmoense]OIN81648.1 hypothetical protein BMG05_06510 [Mycobacterium malmoense]